MRRLSSPILRWAWVPYLILVITLFLSLIIMFVGGSETGKNDSLRFTNLVERTQGTLTGQMDNYITLLEGASGLHAASDEVTRTEFKTYVERLNLRKKYPGVQGIGFLNRIPAAEKEVVEEEVRASGLPTFRIWPDNGQPYYYPILFIEPMDERNMVALGYDMHTEPIRREAMDRAVAVGGPAMSGRVTLVQEITSQKQAGFLIYLPVYASGIIPPTKEERDSSLLGFIYSPFRADDLFTTMLRGEKSPQLDFQVYDGAPDEKNLLHDSRNFANSRDPLYKPRYTRTEKILIAGKPWTIRYSSNKSFDAASDIWFIPFVLIFGLFISGILFMLTRAQYEAGRKAEISEANLHYIAEAGKILASSLDYKRTVTAIAHLGIPQVADWCSVDLRNGKKIESLAIVHKDERKVRLAREYQKRHPRSLRDNSGVGKVIRTGESEYVPIVTDTMLRRAANTQDDYRFLREIGFSSVMIVPLRVQRKVIGTMTFVSSSPKRHYSRADLSMAEEIAQRAAMAIEHAGLFAESEQAVEMRDEFISVASHELKTPVTSLKMYLQVLHKQLLKKREHKLAQTAEKMDAQIDKLTLLITDLLNVSRIQHGRLEFHDAYFDLGETVREVTEQVQATSRDHTIAVRGKLKRKTYGDRDRISQVITNLLTNAIKYSPEAASVEVMLSETKEAAQVSVRDEGIGIAKEHVGKIFSRFYRVSDPSEKTFPGLGIGLFISQEIVRRHGGVITVESEKGKGSVFRFTVPYRRSA